MNNKKYLLILINSFLILSCIINPQSDITPIAKHTSIFDNAPTATLTPQIVDKNTVSPTLLPKNAKETIQKLLQEPTDCLAPCMWSITPKVTNIENAINVYKQLGMKLSFVSEKGSKKYYDTNYRFPSGLYIMHMITADNGIVTNIRVNITPPKNAQLPREWSSYSPETLIQRYAEPSKVGFLLARIRDANSQPIAWYTMDLFFEDVELIVEYGNSEILYSKSKAICPLRDQYESVTLWFGNESENQPQGGMPLSEATNLQIQDFVKLITSTSKDGCFELNVDIFP